MTLKIEKPQNFEKSAASFAPLWQNWAENIIFYFYVVKIYKNANHSTTKSRGKISVDLGKCRINKKMTFKTFINQILLLKVTKNV